MDYPQTENIDLARLFHPEFMTRPVFCPSQELLFYALATTLEAAHALHITGQHCECAVVLDALMALLNCDPINTGMLVTELMDMGFHVTTPICGRFVPSVTPFEERKEEDFQP